MMALSTKFKIQIARLLSSILRFGYRTFGIKEDIITVKRRGTHWELDLKEAIDVAIFLGVYERTTIQAFQKLIKRDNTVLDIGANIGAHTLVLAKQLCNAGRVYAFEPTHYAFSKLNKNIGLNQSIKLCIVAEQVMFM